MSEHKLPTVGDLIAKLSTLDPALPVVLSEDSEGNGFDTWSGDVSETLYDTEYRETRLTPEQFAADQASEKPRYTEDDEPPEIDDVIVRAVVIWP
jgi:hypothetical protein